MSFVAYLFKFLSTVVSIYAFICVIRIFLTWIPGAEYSQFGNFIKAFCDPWLNLFHKLSFARSSGVDFTPIISIGVLYIISAVFRQIATTQTISIAALLVIILSMAWSICSSIITIFIIVVLLRLISQLFSWTNPFWYNLDRAIEPVSSWIRKHILGNRFIKPNTLTGITLAISIGVQLIGSVLINILANLLYMLPF
ncbi:MAG: hypothetical protein BKP49_03990 [Treponema sp. CETP13]|nr:MAG: hypothetical protein BKP49_03990 [Treponema sp. CETP13]